MTPPPTDEKALPHDAARVALMACSSTLERSFPNCLAVLRAYIDEQESELTAARAEVERLKKLSKRLAAIATRDHARGCICWMCEPDPKEPT